MDYYHNELDASPEQLGVPMTPTHDVYLLPDTIGQEKWDRRFIAVAELVSSWSKDPSTKCGAVIVRPDRTIASVGYNGFPRGCNDDPTLYANRDLKLSRVLHAEVNAVLHANEPLTGFTMYTHPAGVSPTCDRCATVVIEAGIERVVHEFDDSREFSSRWAEAGKRALQMYAESHVEVVDL